MPASLLRTGDCFWQVFPRLGHFSLIAFFIQDSSLSTPLSDHQKEGLQGKPRGYRKESDGGLERLCEHPDGAPTIVGY